HRLAARRTLVFRLHGGLARRLALAGLDVLAPLLEARAADEVTALALAGVAHQRPAALRAHLARLHAALTRHLGLGRLQRLGERPPELVEHLVVLALP